MIEHAARDHAQWSASATDRNVGCPGAMAMEQGKPDRENPSAAWGTACHQVAEAALRGNQDAADFIGSDQRTKTSLIEVDDEMADTAQVYVDYVRKRAWEAAAEGKGSHFWIEQRFNLDRIEPPFEAGGTADAVIYFPVLELVEIGDLKGGRGYVVEAVGNSQLRTYALGVVLAHPELKIKRVRVTIIQPRAGHPSGRIRSEEFHVIDLMEWAADLKAAMFRTKEALDAYAQANTKGKKELWYGEYLNAGDHCKFCKARATCPALAKHAVERAGLWFNNYGQPQIANKADELSPDTLSRMLDGLDLIEEWANAVRAHAQQLAEAGVTIPNYVLVDKIARRKWKDEDAVGKHLADLGIPASDIFQTKVNSPNQIEKKLGTKRKHMIEHLWEKPLSGHNLVRVNKTTRQPVLPKAQKFFQAYE